MIEVNYVDHMGTDLSVVNAAKVSFGSRSEWAFVNTKKDGTRNFVLHPKDQSLISFLARGCTSGEWASLKRDVTIGHDDSVFDHIRKMPAHWSPFAHTAITMNIKMPIFVARQIMKHTTGIEFNEISRRYVKSTPNLFTPDKWRESAEDVKQGSSNKEALGEEYFYYEYKDDDSVVPYRWQCGVDITLGQVIEDFNEKCLGLYQDMIDRGVAPEQARMVLPQSMMTEVVMTGNLYALANLYNQRIDPHAQYESQLVAKGVGDILSDLFPHSFKELTK